MRTKDRGRDIGEQLRNIRRVNLLNSATTGGAWQGFTAAHSLTRFLTHDLAPSGQPQTLDSSVLGPVSARQKNQSRPVSAPRGEISDSPEPQTDLSPRSPSPACQFCFSGEHIEFLESVPLCTGRTLPPSVGCCGVEFNIVDMDEAGSSHLSGVL